MKMVLYNLYSYNFIQSFYNLYSLRWHCESHKKSLSGSNGIRTQNPQRIPWHSGKLKSVDSLWNFIRDVITYSQIKNLDRNKAHDHVMVSIHKLRICGGSVLKLIFKSCIRTENFPSNGNNKTLPYYQKETIVRLCCCLFVARY